jgi:hypothetical protein
MSEYGKRAGAGAIGLGKALGQNTSQQLLVLAHGKP